MSRLLSILSLFCVCIPSCRGPSPGARAVAEAQSKATRAPRTGALEIFPRVIEEPQPISDAVLAQPETAACLADARELRDPGFVVELSGRVSRTGTVTEPRVGGVAAPIARCLTRALADLVVLPGQPGPFRLTLSRTSGGAGAGVIVEPGVGTGVGKKFE